MSAQDEAAVVIVGGAIVGSAVAAFLARRTDFDGRILVVERDPTYATASTTLSAASIRQQFSTPLNIEISRFGIDFMKRPDQWFGDAARVPSFDFTEGGYLFLATAEGLPVLERNHAVQRANGVAVTLLTPLELRSRFPWLNTEDLAAGSLGLADEGWFDAHALLQAFRGWGRRLGIEQRTAEVAHIEREGSRVKAVRLTDGHRIGCDWLVNAAGARAAEIATMAGLALPVAPRKRCVYHFACQTEIGPVPLTVDPSGIYFRPEGPAYLSGYSPKEGQPDPDTLDLTVDRSRFETHIWPALAQRVPAFDSLRLLNAWAGLYEVNTLDHNAVIGPHPEVKNFLFANGFSGHGLQQAPAVGRGLAEFIASGAYETIDLSPLGYARIMSNEPLRELNVV